MTKPPEESLIESVIEEALGPYIPLLPPHLVEEFRKSLRLGLGTHPKAQDLLNRLRARPVRAESGKRRVDGGEDHEEQGDRGTGGAR